MEEKSGGGSSLLEGEFGPIGAYCWAGGCLPWRSFSSGRGHDWEVCWALCMGTRFWGVHAKVNGQRSGTSHQHSDLNPLLWDYTWLLFSWSWQTCLQYKKTNRYGRNKQRFINNLVSHLETGLSFLKNFNLEVWVSKPKFWDHICEKITRNSPEVTVKTESDYGWNCSVMSFYLTSSISAAKAWGGLLPCGTELSKITPA